MDHVMQSHGFAPWTRSKFLFQDRWRYQQLLNISTDECRLSCNGSILPNTCGIQFDTL